MTLESIGPRAPLHEQLAFMRREFKAMRVPCAYANVVAEPRGYRIPYESIDFYRVKLMRKVGDKKYDQPPGETHVYFSPGFSPLVMTMILTEGEKKAICAAYHFKVPAIGIGGKDNWHSSGRRELLPELQEALGLLLPGATLIVVPDGDIHNRLDIQASYGSLVHAIRKLRKDIIVVVKALPEHEPRLGLDDWMVQTKRTRTLLDLMNLPDMGALPRMRADIMGDAEFAFIEGKNGTKSMLCSEYNLSLYLSRGFDFQWDSTLGPIERDGVAWHRLQDHHIVKALEAAQRDLKLRFTLAMARNSVDRIARESPTNVLGEWLEEQKWDGVPRARDLFKRYVIGDTTHAEKYLEEVALCFLTGMVARAINPGCKYDNMLVLVGPQGIGKSLALKIIAGGDDYYAEVTHISSVDDLKRVGSRVWLVDVAELHSYNRLEVAQVKGWLTAATDTFIDKFDKHPTNRPKGYVVAGSTNEGKFLRDPSGEERRYMAVRVTRTMLDDLKRDRAQILAEALHLYRRHGVMYVISGMEREQQQHKVRPVWADQLEEIVEGAMQMRKLPTCQGEHVLTLQWVFNRLNQPGVERHSKEVGMVLRSFGWDDNNGLMRNSRDIHFGVNTLQPLEFFRLNDGKMPRQVRFWTHKK